MGKSNRLRRSSAYKKNNKEFGPDPNKSDGEIINELIHLLNVKDLDLDKFLVNPETRRTPRPQNAFILYRNYKMASPEFKNRPTEDKQAKDVSKEIADDWNNETNTVKKLFFALQRKADKKHKEIFKNYKF